MITIDRTVDISKPVQTETLRGNEFTGEQLAHTFKIHVTRDGVAVPLTGTVTARFFQANGASLLLAETCGLEDGAATVTLIKACYDIPGRFALAIYHTENGEVTCIYSAVGAVVNVIGDPEYDPGNVIGDISTLIDTANQAAEDAQEALDQATAVVSYAEQTGKTDAEKAQARTNIGAASEADVDAAMAEHFPATGKLVAGISTTASANGAVATGVSTTASGRASHAEGQLTTADGQVAHAEGYGTTASGDYSHAEGFGTKARGDHQHAFGKYNVEDTNDTYLEIAGNGTGDNARSNARTLDWNGNETLAGDLTVNKGGAVEMAVGNELSSLKSALDALPYYNEYNPADVDDGYIDTQGNIITVTPGWYISDYMPVTAGDTVYYSGLTNAGISPSSAYYDDEKTLKSIFKQATGSNAFVVPDGISYVRFSIASVDKETFVLNIKKVPSFEDVSELKNELTAKYNQGVEQIAPRNWFDKANATTATVSGNPVLVSPFVAVVEGETFYYSYHLSQPSQLVSMPFFCVYYYDAKQTQIGTSANWINSYTVPSGAAYVKFVVAQPTAQYIMVEKGVQTLVWADYAAPYYIGKTSDEELQYPTKIYGVAGHELNVYYENAIRYGTMDTIAKCDISGLLPNCKRYRDRLIWTPQGSASIKEIVSMYKSDTKTVNAWKPVTFVSAPADTGTDTVKVLVIGDSKTAYGQPTGYLQDLFDNDGMTLELLGTRWGNNCTDQDTTNRHEGRGAWGAYTYCNASTGWGDMVNPFYDANYTDSTYGGHFNFSKYMSDQGYTGVDFVFINLGTNDYGGSSYTYWTCMMAIITSIQKYANDNNKTVYIVPVLMEGVYADKLEWATRNEAFFGFRQRLLNNAAMTNVYYNPMYLSMDLHNDFPFTEVPLSYADEFVGDGKTRKYCDDGIHQNPAGFYKNAFSMYAILKCIKAGVA